MKQKLLILLGLVLLVSSRHIQSHYSDDDYVPHSHYAGFEDQYPSHYYDDDDYAHEQQEGGAMQALFQALKNDPNSASILKSPPRDEASYNRLQNSIISTLKKNSALQSKLADDMFGNGQIGALFNSEQRVKLLNYVMQNPEMVRGGKDSAKGKLINFIKNDPELSKIYEANQNTFSG